MGRSRCVDRVIGVDDSSSAASGRFHVVPCWQALEPQDAADLLEFWLREGALPDEERARARLPEVVAYARADDDGIAGICTAYVETSKWLGQPMYHYRSFVGAQWRRSRVVMGLMKAGMTALQEYAAAHDFPAVGLMLELESPRFQHALADRPVWRLGHGLDLTYVGKGPRGFDLRVYYFPRARLRRA